MKGEIKMTENINENVINEQNTMDNNVEIVLPSSAPSIEENQTLIEEKAAEAAVQPVEMVVEETTQEVIPVVPVIDSEPQSSAPQASQPQPQPSAPQYNRPKPQPQRNQFSQQPPIQKPYKENKSHNNLWFRIVMTVLVAVIAGLLMVNTISIIKLNKRLENVKNAIESFELPAYSFGDLFGNGQNNNDYYNYNLDPYYYNYGDSDDFFSQYFNNNDEDNYWYYKDSNGDFYGNQNENQQRPGNEGGQNNQGDGFSLDDIFNFFSGFFGGTEDTQGA